MAYYSSSYYQTGHDDHGEYYLTSYAHNPDDSAPVSYSSYEDPSFQNLLEYQYPNPTSYYHANCHSASAYSNPISIQYDPPKFYEQSYETGVTQFLISYSVSPEFNDPEIDDYDDYDPTPYGGGYNIDSQYGKPLPPSNETCYPRGGSSSPLDLKPPNLNGAIVPVSVGGNEPIADDEQAAKPIKEISQPTKEEEPGQVLDGVPSGYGLEAMDMCESLFGYWPCLARDLRRSNCEPGNDLRYSCEGRYENSWKGAADYLFGSSNPYGGERTTYYEYEDYRG